LSAVVNALIIGFSFLFVKIALGHADPVDLLAHRFAFGFAAFAVAAAFGRMRFRLRGKPVVKVFWLAALYPLGFFLLQTYGLQYATSSEGGILLAFVPVLTMVMGIVFLKEKASFLQQLSIALSVVGVVVIFTMRGSGFDWGNMAGIVLLFLSCLFFAGYSVLARSLMKTFRPMEITFLTLGIGFIAFLTLSLVRHAAAGTLNQLLAPLAEGEFLTSMLFLGVMSSLVTALTANYALSKLEASRAGVFSNLSPVVSMAAGALVLGEQIGPFHIVGAVLIVAGVWGANYFGAKARKALASSA
jgi:drug/metabolite transporter (DMT)-like permease